MDSRVAVAPDHDNVTTHAATTYAVDAGAPIVNCNSARSIRLGVVGVELTNPANQRSIEIYALLDTGCDTTMLSDAVATELGLSGVRSPLAIGGVNTTRSVSAQYVDVRIRGKHVPESYELRGVPCVPRLPDAISSLPDSLDVGKCPHLSDVAFATVSRSKCDMIIGADRADLMRHLEVRDAGPLTLFGFCTPLGWTAIGPEPAQRGTHGPRGMPSTQAYFTTLRSDTGPGDICEQLERAYHVEFNEAPDDEDKTMSVGDTRALAIAEATVTLAEGHYTVDVPFSGPVRLPDNYPQARARLFTLRRRFHRDPVLFTKYSEKMADLQKKGYVERVEHPETTNTGNVWYLTHFATKQNKFRIVYDGSACFKNNVLNRHILSGPDLLTPLTHVVARFRKGAIAFMADIAECFFQVKLPVRQRNFFRILWLEDGRIDGAVEVWRFTVHVWGVNSSSFTATFCIRKAALDNLTHASPATIAAVLNNMYLDDLLMSTNTRAEAMTIIREMIPLLAAAGFELTKWTSNDRTLLEGIPRQNRAPAIRDLDLTTDDMPVQKAMGLQWLPEEDVLRIKVSHVVTPLTRRGVLQRTHANFDPVGFSAPFMLEGKLIFQDLCSHGNLGWDDEMPTADARRWGKWLSSLPDLERLTVPRCYAPTTLKSTYLLHAFSDASNYAYGAVTYLSVSHGTQTQVGFVFAKSRVIPKKKRLWSVPRKELIAAVTGTHLAQMSIEALDLPCLPVTFWTDSTTVLKWIGSDQLRHKLFVGRQIAKIKKFSSPLQWRYCPTSENPADYAFSGPPHGGYSEGLTVAARACLPAPS